MLRLIPQRFNRFVQAGCRQLRRAGKIAIFWGDNEETDEE